MSSTKHVVVWIDHHEAKLFHVDSAGLDRAELHVDPATLHHPGKTGAHAESHRQAAEDHPFFDSISTHLGGLVEVLVVGPSNAKTELVAYLKDAPQGRGEQDRWRRSGRPSDRRPDRRAREEVLRSQQDVRPGLSAVTRRGQSAHSCSPRSKRPAPPGTAPCTAALHAGERCHATRGRAVQRRRFSAERGARDARGPLRVSLGRRRRRSGRRCAHRSRRVHGRGFATGAPSRASPSRRRCRRPCSTSARATSSRTRST